MVIYLAVFYGMYRMGSLFARIASWNQTKPLQYQSALWGSHCPTRHTHTHTMINQITPESFHKVALCSPPYLPLHWHFDAEIATDPCICGFSHFPSQKKPWQSHLIIWSTIFPISPPYGWFPMWIWWSFGGVQSMGPRGLPSCKSGMTIVVYPGPGRPL